MPHKQLHGNYDGILNQPGASQLPSTGGLTTGTFQPTSYVSALAGNDDFPLRAPAPPPAPDNLAPSASASAQLTTSFLFAGNRNITAVYNGNLQTGGGGFTGSNSNAQPLVQMVFGPTAAGVTISGRVSSGSTGRAVSRAMLVLTSSTGDIRYTMTNPFGYYRFVNVPAGESYVLSVSSKSHEFGAPILMTLNDSIMGVDLVSLD